MVFFDRNFTPATIESWSFFGRPKTVHKRTPGRHFPMHLARRINPKRKPRPNTVRTVTGFDPVWSALAGQLHNIKKGVQLPRAVSLQLFIASRTPLLLITHQVSAPCELLVFASTFQVSPYTCSSSLRRGPIPGLSAAVAIPPQSTEVVPHVSQRRVNSPLPSADHPAVSHPSRKGEMANSLISPGTLEYLRAGATDCDYCCR